MKPQAAATLRVEFTGMDSGRVNDKAWIFLPRKGWIFSEIGWKMEQWPSLCCKKFTFRMNFQSFPYREQSSTLSQRHCSIKLKLKFANPSRQLFASKQLQREVKSNKLHSDVFLTCESEMDWLTFVCSLLQFRLLMEMSNKSFQHLAAESICSADWLWLSIADNKLGGFEENRICSSKMWLQTCMSSNAMISSWLRMFECG